MLAWKRKQYKENTFLVAFMINSKLLVIEIVDWKQLNAYTRRAAHFFS